jgi:flagellar FliL protein
MSDAGKDKKPEGAAEATAPKSALMGKLLLPIFAVVNLGVLGLGAFLTYQSTLGYQPQVLVEPSAEDFKKQRELASIAEGPVNYTMPAFTANLNGSPRRLVRIEMTFEMLDADGFEEIVRNNPRARDTIIRILNRKSFDDIETIQGKLRLKDQISVALNQDLHVGVVKDIYFNEFLVQ